jgi:HAD superfamily hydrolase (TIGR01509 family)
VFKAEVERLPWIPGVLDVLRSLKASDVPSMLVTTSPRRMAENIMAQADGLFAGYICGDDPYAHKPDPAPYLAAAEKLGLDRKDVARCVVLEDSPVGLGAGAATGATLIAQTGWIRTDTSGLGQFASISSYEGIDAAALDAFVCRRLGRR